MINKFLLKEARFLNLSGTGPGIAFLSFESGQRQKSWKVINIFLTARIT